MGSSASTVINRPSDVSLVYSIEEHSNCNISPAGIITGLLGLGGVKESPDANAVAIKKSFDFLGDCDEEVISFLVLEDYLFHVEYI
jgi:hypothetical protein